MRPSSATAKVVGKERCESGRIGLTANELAWETGPEGSNPSLSAAARWRPSGPAPVTGKKGSSDVSGGGLNW